MTHIRGLVTTAQALRHTFIQSIDVQRFQLARFGISRTRITYPILPVPFSRSSRRSFFAPTQIRPSSQQVVYKDEDIPAQRVQMVNETGALEPPISLRDALVSFDRSSHFLLQVAPETYERPAICKIKNKREVKDREKQKAKQAKSQVPKQIELNWGIDQHDLSHRLKQMHSFLEKGRKVECTLLRKPRKKPATLDQARDLLQKVKQYISDIGATETKPMDGKLLGHLKLIVEMKKKP